jgi:hypothetical protein
MKRGTLGISWLNETLTAAWAGRDGVVQTWHAPAAVKDGAMLSGAMREVCRRSGEDLRRVVLLMDHRNLLFHVQETPPAKGRLLDQMLERLIAENRFFDEPSVWAKLELPPGARHHRWLLALTPQSIWNDIKSACDENELDLVGLYPATALLARHLGKVRAEPGEAVLLIADFGGSHGLLVGRGDGQILFARSIAASRSETEGRLDQEINRTLHFAEQRFGGKVSRIVAMGERCESALSGRPLREGLNVETLVADLEDPALAAGASDGGPGIRLNFVRRSLWQSPWARPVLAAGMAALLLVSMATAAWVLDQARTQSLEQERWKREVRAAARIRETRLSRGQEWDNLRALIVTVGDPDQPAVVSAFCRYLQTTTPATLRLTGLDLERVTNGWALRLEGISREQGGRFVSGIEEWEAGMTGGVFRVRVEDSTHRRSVAGSSAGLGSTLPMSGEGRVTPKPEPGEKPFFLSGTIQ